MNSETHYQGRFCSGSGDTDYLELLDKSLAMFTPQADLPFFQMLLCPEYKTLKEGFMWGNGWWIQNSFGFSKNAIAFLSPFWLEIVQNSYDLFWDRIGDGKRWGSDSGTWEEGQPHYFKLVAPDGSLGDAVEPGKAIIYKQFDGKTDLHDWFYETAAAQLMIQSDILLRKHSSEQVQKYLPLMERTCAFIERTRDPINDLFLVGPASNLLAPSYGGSFDETTGTVGKGYLTGLSVTYAGALKLLVEVCKLAKENEKAAYYDELKKRTENSLKLLLTEENYLAKSMDPDGTKHGVFGAQKFGYLDGVTNIDAIAWEAVSTEIQESIYNKINSINIRPFDFLQNNAPALDDTYVDYLKEQKKGLFDFGTWVDGGCWGTVEGRAMLAYSRLKQFDVIRRSVKRSTEWAEDYRMDAPFSNCGENTYNPWSDRKDKSEVSVMIDNFAIPAGMLRGVFDVKYDHAGISFTANLPDEMNRYTQKCPYYFGDKQLYFTVTGTGKILGFYLNGTFHAAADSKNLHISFEELPEKAYIEIVRGAKISSDYAEIRRECETVSEFDWNALNPLLTEEMKSYVREHPNACKADQLSYSTLSAIASYSEKQRQSKASLEHFRPLTDTKKAQILDLYQKTAENLMRLQ